MDFIVVNIYTIFIKNKSTILKKAIPLFIVIILICSSCEKETDPFLVSKHSIGALTDSTEVRELKTIYLNDSIYTYISGDEFMGNTNDIEIYEKSGTPLLVLTPSHALDSTSTIRTVKVVDHRFRTSKGLTSSSTFKNIKDNYKISSIQNTLRNIIVSVDEINAYFTIDKNELPADMRFNMDLKIEAIQIPESAKIKSFYLYWTKKAN